MKARARCAQARNAVAAENRSDAGAVEASYAEPEQGWAAVVWAPGEPRVRVEQKGRKARRGQWVRAEQKGRKAPGEPRVRAEQKGRKAPGEPRVRGSSRSWTGLAWIGRVGLATVSLRCRRTPHPCWSSGRSRYRGLPSCGGVDHSRPGAGQSQSRRVGLSIDREVPPQRGADGSTSRDVAIAGRPNRHGGHASDLARRRGAAFEVRIRAGGM